MAAPQMPANDGLRPVGEVSGSDPTMDPAPESETYLTVPEVAADLRISKMTVYRMIHTGELGASRFGRTFRVTKEDLAACKKRARMAVES